MWELNNKVYGVGELNLEIKRLLENNTPPQIWVRGEICEYSPRSDSGHVYFSLKDPGGIIRAVQFRGYKSCQALGLAIGTEVEVLGAIRVYEVSGIYQILVSNIRLVSDAGALHRRFEEMKAKLRAEGLFDQERKRPIPPFPRCVGVVTAKDGAALQDFLNVLQRRHSGLHIRIIPTKVQGADAAPRIAAAIDYINQQRLCDVIVVTRGGGSPEDLWPFNEEILARAVVASDIPVISAVGHERDFSICDLAADMRCATPSVAAEQVIQAKEMLYQRVSNASTRLTSKFNGILSDYRRRLDVATVHSCLSKPGEFLNNRRQMLDNLNQRITPTLRRMTNQNKIRLEGVSKHLKPALPNAVQKHGDRYRSVAQRVAQLKNRVTENPRKRHESLTSLLVALSPRAVLGRGYAILMDSEGRAVRRANDVSANQNLRALLGEGELDVKVRNINE